MSLRVTSSGGCAAALLWIFALGWTAMLTVFAIRIPRSELSPGAWAALAVFAVAGVVLVAMAIRESIRAARFRGAWIDLETNPGVLGGKLAGVIHLDPSPRSRGEGGRRPGEGRHSPLSLTLSNWRRDDTDELLWETTTALDPTGRFSFDMPFDCEPTSDTAYWRLLLDDGASFIVPVLQTAASSPAQTQRSLRKTTYEAPPETHVRVERGTVRLPLPSWLWRWYAIVLLVVAGGYLAGTYLYGAEMLGIVAVAAIVLCAIPLPTLAMTVRRIEADPGGLTFRYVLLRRPKRIVPADVGVQYANGALHYELTFEGAKAGLTIITLRSRAEAEWVAYELRRALTSS